MAFADGLVLTLRQDICNHYEDIGLFSRAHKAYHDVMAKTPGPFRMIKRAVLLVSLQWRHNKRDGVPNHQPHDCLLNGLLRRRSMKTSQPRVTALCEGNSPVTGSKYYLNDAIITLRN